MDDIQFWLYLAFAGFYFLSRMMKKKAPEPMPEETEQEQGPRKKPVTFEELLREITEQRQATAPEPVVQEAPKPIKIKKQSKPEFEEEGVRRFSDEESRKVYEQSIKMAEGYDLSFERSPSFKSSVSRRNEEEHQQVAAGILASLQSPDSARKAVILGEILNRKY